VLLGGDTAVVPARFGWSGAYGGGTCPTDLYYSCLDGNWNRDGDERWGEGGNGLAAAEADIFPELFVARAPVNDATETQSFVNRVLAYETPIVRNYQASALFCTEVLVPANWDSGQVVVYDGAPFSEAMISESVPPAFSVQRQYDTYWNYPSSSKLRKATSIAAMNSGLGIVNQLGHGFTNTMSLGDLSLVNSDADALTNGERSFVLCMANCAAVAFDYNCLAERFLLNPNGGASGVIGASRSVAAGLIPYYNRAFYRQLFQYGKTHLAETLNAMRLERAALADYDGQERWVQFALNALGDPEMTIFTGPVREAQMMHAVALAQAPDTLQVGVTADSLPVAGAQICAWKGDEVYAVGITDAAGEVSLPMSPESPGTLLLTLSGANLALRTDTLAVTPSQGPVLRFESVLVDDDSTGASAGNADGNLDAGETAELLLRLHDSGGAPAYGVAGAVASSDPRLQVLQGAFAVDSVGTDQTAQAVAPVVVHLAPDIPDGTVLPLAVQATGAASGTWSDVVRLGIGAPRPEVTRVVPIGGLPGTCSFTVEVENYGSGLQPALEGSLAALDSGVAVVQGAIHFEALGALATAGGTTALEVQSSGPGPARLVLSLADAYGRSFTQRVDLHPPAKPARPVFDPTFAVGQMRLYWTPSPDADLLGYLVFRAPFGIRPFARLSHDIILHSEYFDATVQPSSSYEYHIVAVDSSKQWSASSDTVAISTTPAMLDGWPRDLPAATSCSVAVGDIDGDGRPDIVVADQGLYAFNGSGGEVLDGDGNLSTQGVFSTLPGTMNSSPALAELDGNPGLEIVAASWNTNLIHVFDGRGQVLPGWPQQPSNGGNTGYWAGPAVADLDGDGVPEIVAVSKDGWLYAWHRDGTPLLAGTDGKVKQVGAWTQTTPALADLDGDGHREIVVAGSTGFLYVLRDDGSDFPGWPRNLFKLSHSSPAIGDVDGDGHPEIVVTSELDFVHVFRTDGTELPGWPKQAPMDSPDLGPSPALGDLDGDGKLEIAVVAVQNPFPLTKLYVYDWQGNVVLQKNLDLNTQSSPILADVDGDGSTDIVVGGEAGVLHAWTLSGAELNGFPIPTGDVVRSTPAYCDLNGDGKGDLVYVGWDRHVYAWSLPGAYRRDRAPWPTFHGDAARTGELHVVSPTPVVDAAPPARLAASWSPNPFNPGTTLRLEVPAVAGAHPHVVVDLFDARGRLVRRLVSGTRPPGRYAVPWNGRDARGARLPSGVYLYRARAGTESLSGKLALVR
jgi:hypothetical protein